MEFVRYAYFIIPIKQYKVDLEQSVVMKFQLILENRTKSNHKCILSLINNSSPHSSVVRVLDLKTRGFGFDPRAGQPNNYYLSFG